MLHCMQNSLNMLIGYLNMLTELLEKRDEHQTDLKLKSKKV